MIDIRMLEAMQATNRSFVVKFFLLSYVISCVIRISNNVGHPEKRRVRKILKFHDICTLTITLRFILYGLKNQECKD